MRTTFNIDDGLLEEARLQARQKKITLGEVVSSALRLGLFRAHGSSSAAATAPLKTFRGDGMQAGIDLHNSAELLEIMERS